MVSAAATFDCWDFRGPLYRDRGSGPHDRFSRAFCSTELPLAGHGVICSRLEAFCASLQSERPSAICCSGSKELWALLWSQFSLRHLKKGMNRKVRSVHARSESDAKIGRTGAETRCAFTGRSNGPGRNNLCALCGRLAYRFLSWIA